MVTEGIALRQMRRAIVVGRRQPACTTPVGHFMAKVVKSDEGCWTWNGAKAREGYGSFRVRGERWRANRLMWLWTHGSLPSDLDVLHRCDNPPCVRPDHLFLGDAKDNAEDARAKGRLRFGSKLNPEQVRQIKVRLASGESHPSIAADYPVTASAIAMISAGRRWAGVK